MRHPLHCAIRDGSERVEDSVARLPAAGADPNAKDKWGETPLHDAARHCRPELVRSLVSHGALVNITSKAGDTPLHVLGLVPWHEGFARCSEPGEATAILRLFLEAGADLTLRNKAGRRVCDETLYADGPTMGEAAAAIRKGLPIPKGEKSKPP